MPSVKFAPSVDKQQSSAKRTRDDEHAETDHRVKKVRGNEDESEDWKDDNVPSEKDLLEAKRKRRQKRVESVEGEGMTRIDGTTSLEAEGIAIEPFHMRNEEDDGTGFFDGDTYVFRKNDLGEEADAWVEDFDEEEGKKPFATPSTQSTKKQTQDSMDDWTKEQLFQRIIPLLSGNETVTQALIRYGRLSEPNKKKAANSATLPAQAAAKSHLNDITGAASSLLLKGVVDIYQSTGADLQRMLPAPKSKTLMERQPPAQWEYLGNLDQQIHGPYSTEEMVGWTKAGYFVGDQQVKIRTIRQEEQLSNQDDLLADLMDDDDDEDQGDKKETKTVKGDWMWSDSVDFEAYLPPP